MSDVHIIPFDENHAPVFDRLNRAWIEQYFTIEPFDNEVLTQPQKMIIDNGGEVWFAQLDGKVVGTFALLPLAPDLFEFTKLGVDESARGKGVARTLLRHAAKRARAHGHKKLRIFTNASLIPACTLYRAEGFKEVHMTPAEQARYQRCNIMFDLAL